MSAATKSLIEAARKAGEVTRKTQSGMCQPLTSLFIVAILGFYPVHIAQLHAMESQCVSAQDYLKLSLTQAKRLEMDAQVRTL